MEINEIKGQITSITSLTSTDAFSVIENKIPDISDLVKKADYDTKKKKKSKKKCFTTSYYNKFTKGMLDAKKTEKR